MSYTGSGFDRRLRNLLFAFESVAPPPPPAPQPPPGAYIWLDGDALTGVDGSPIASWADAGSAAAPAVAAPPTPSPTVVDDFDGAGHRGALFDGTQALAWIGGLDFAGALGVTVCGVLISTSADGGVLLASFQTRDWGMFYSAPDALGVFTTVSVTSNPVFPNSALYAFEMQQPRDGSDVPRFWKNGGTAAGAGSSFIGSVEDVPLATAIGVNLVGGSGWAGAIGDLLIYKRQFDAADRADWGAYIASKYGL